ncbi:MAG: hypothetical protein RIC55_32655 [Pirellulaceae bacterium]
MSHWQPSQPSFQDSFPPHPSQQFQRPPQRGPGRGLPWLILGGLAVLLCVGVGGMAVLLRWKGLPGVAQPADTADQQWAAESDEERRRDLVAGFGARDVGVSGPTLNGLERFLAEYVEVCHDGDPDRLREILDVERTIQQIKSYPMTPSLTYFDEQLLRDQIAEQSQHVEDWSSHALLHAELSPSRREAKLHVGLWDQAGELFEYRMWLVRAGRRWKVYDREYTRFDDRDSLQWAKALAYGDTPQWDEYLAGVQETADADAQIELGENDAAFVLLRRAEHRLVHPAVVDNYAIHLAYAWSRAGRSPKLLAWSRKVRDAQALPGGVYGQALAREEFGQYLRVLESVDELEALLGDSPNVMYLRGRAYDALGRREEAAEQWMKLLDIHPSDDVAFSWLADALPPERTGELIDYIRRSEDPLATAKSLFDEYAYRADASVRRALVELISELAPDSLLLRRARAVELYNAEEYDQAAEMYLALYADDEDEDAKSTWLYEYLDCMMAAEKAYDGYLRAPEPEVAYDYLTGAYDEGDYDISDDEFARVLAAHREKHPDAAWLSYYEVDLLIRQQQYPLAEKLAKSRLPTIADEYEQSSLRERLAWVMAKQDKHLKAYADMQRSDVAFQAVADLCVADKKPQILRDLALERRKDAPGDPWVPFYEALACQLEQDHDLALRFLKIAEQVNVEDEALSSRCRRTRVELALEAGNLVTQFQQLEDRDDEFAGIAARLLAERRLEELGKLLQFQRSTRSVSPSLDYYRIQHLWESGEYEKLVDQFSDWPGENFEGPNWQSKQSAALIVKSMLRANETARAATLAAKLDDEYGFIKPLLLTAIFTGDRPTIERNLEEFHASEGAYSMSTIYLDDLVGEKFRDPQYLDLRRRFPSELRTGYSTQQITLLLDSAATFDAEQLKQKLEGVLDSDFEVTPLPSLEFGPKCESFVISTGDDRIGVACCAAPFLSEEAARSFALTNPELERALLEHQAWLTITALDRGAAEESMQVVEKIAAALLPQLDCLAAHFETDDLLVSADQCAAALASPDVAAAVEQVGADCYLYRDDVWWSARAEANKSACETLPEFRAAFRGAPPEADLWVLTTWSLGETIEPVWIDVERIDRGDYGTWRYTGRLLEDSLLDSRYQQGEPVRVGESEILDWTYRDAQRSVRAESKPMEDNSSDKTPSDKTPLETP